MAINSLSASSNGLAGLASGIDTESIVESMLAGTKNKITAATQKKTQLEYKQAMYHDIMSQLKTFQQSYFSFSSSTNLKSNNFFQQMAATTTSKAYTVTGTSSASAGKFTIDAVKSLATSHKQTYNQKVSGVVEGAVDTEKIKELAEALKGEKLTFKVGEQSVEITADQLAGKSNTEAAKIINQALEGAGVAASASFKRGKITVTADDSSQKVAISGTAGAVGLVGGNNLKGAEGSNSFAFVSKAALPSIDVTVDGVTKSIAYNPLEAIDADGNVDIDKIASQLNDGMKNSFGSGLKVTAKDGKISFGETSASQSRQITVGGSNAGLAALGLTKNLSNKLTTGAALNKTNFGTKLIGDTQSFSINGVDFSFDTGTSLNTIMNAVNSSEAGVRITYSNTTDTFTMESTVTGERDSDFTVSQSEGNLMQVMFGYDMETKVTGATSSVASFKLTDSEGTLSKDTKMSDLGAEAGKTYEITLDGSTFTYSGDDTLQDVVDKINAAKDSGIPGVGVVPPSVSAELEIKESNAYIRIAGVAIPMDFFEFAENVETKVVTETTMTETDPAALYTTTAGSNAVITVDGVDVERATNDFTVNGIAISLNETTNEKSTVTVTQNTDAIYDTVVKFVDDYNKLVNNINELLDAKATYRDYPPLTKEQEDEMSERQIELWEEKAKGGLLRNDSTLTAVLQSLRSTLYTKPEGASALYELGINTSYFSTKDNLVIEDANALKEKIAADPEAVKALFTDADKGLSALLDAAITNAASSTGTITAVAGATTNDVNSTIYKESKLLDDKLDSLQDRYESEYTRYWNQFNAMEQMISNMNSTSSWLTQMLGTNG